MEGMGEPTSISSFLANLIHLINDFQRKNTTMINYYIYPMPTPTEIAAYEPRLLIHRTRLQNLARLDINQASALIDDVVLLIIQYTVPSIEQLANASLGIQDIFINYYDRGLERSRPYDAIHDTLRHYQQILVELHGRHMNNPHRKRAEHHVPPPGATLPSLCRGAVLFINNRDHGKVSNVEPADLLPHHHGRLADRGGVVLWWECHVCAFKLRYHASVSANLSINSTDEIRREEDVDDIVYRSAWLAKCHIYHHRPPKPAAPSPPTSPKIKEPEPMPPPPPKQRSSTGPKRVSFARRRSSGNSYITITTSRSHIRTATPTSPTSPTSTTSSTSSTNPFEFPRSNIKSKRSDDPATKKKPKPPKEPTGPNGLRYFCPFCVAQGKQMIGPPPLTSSSDSSDDDAPDPTCFEDSKDLIEHIDEKHTRDRPIGLLLQKFRVAVKGQVAPEHGGTGRWDLDLRA